MFLFFSKSQSVEFLIHLFIILIWLKVHFSIFSEIAHVIQPTICIFNAVAVTSDSQDAQSEIAPLNQNIIWSKKTKQQNSLCGYDS